MSDQLENKGLNDYVSNLQKLGVMQGQQPPLGGFIPGGFIDQPVVNRVALTEEEQIAESFKALAQVIVSLPVNESLKRAREGLRTAAEYLTRYFVSRALGMDDQKP